MRFSALKRQSGRTSGRRLADRAGGADRAGRLHAVGGAGGAQRGWPHMEALEGRMLFSGDLDPTFGAGGVVFTDTLEAISASAEAVVVYQSDGKIVAAGRAENTVDDSAVARYNPDGSLDTSFGTEGRVQFAFAGGQITSAAIDGSGRIVLGGQRDGDFVALRLTAAGALDTSFGLGGVATVDMGSTSDIAFGIAIDASGHIVLGGQTLGSLTRLDFAAARLTSAGALDTAFGTDGRVVIDVSAGNDAARGIAIDSQGRIVLGGFSHSPEKKGADFALVRLAAGGAIDAGFAGGAPVTADLASGDDVAYGVAIDSLDRIVLGGSRGHEFAAARFTEAGALDLSFDGDGWASIDLGASKATGGARSVAIDSQDRVVLGGGAFQSKGGDFGAVRFTPEGALDTTFAGQGWVTLNRSSNDSAFGVAIDSLDQVVLAGHTLDPGANDFEFSLARLTAAGELDEAFGVGGWVTTAFGISRDDIGQRVAVAPSGHMVVLGASTSTSAALATLTRYNPDGSLDISFGAEGHVLGLPIDAVSVAVDAQGRILIVGGAGGLEKEGAAAVARFTASGDLDTSFGAGGVATLGSSTFSQATAVGVDSLGRILVTGQSRISKNLDFAVARLTGSGQFDITFGDDGVASADFSSTSDQAFTLAIDAQDRVILAGRALVGKTTDFAAARFTTSGALDTTFGVGGWASADLGSGGEEARAIAIDSLGRIVLAVSSGAGSADFAAVRLTDAGALDTSFDGDGWIAIEVGGAASAELAFGIAVDARDRTLLSACTLGSGGNFDFVGVRLTASGALDTTFGAGGIAIHDLGLGADDFASGMAVDALGNLLIVGQTFRPGTGLDIALARLLAEPPTPPPSIVAVDVGRDFHTVQIDFAGQQLDHARATDASNYFILASGGDGNGDGDAFNDGDEVLLTIDSADYDAATGRVTLTTSEAIFDDQFRIGIDGDDAATDSAAGITDTLGRFLDGGDFTALIDLQSLGMVGDLITHVEGLGLKTGAETSLVAKLEAAAKNLGMSVDSGMGVTAILSAFMNGVEHWFDRGEISQADRDLLLDRAQYIIDGLVALRM